MAISEEEGAQKTVMQSREADGSGEGMLNPACCFSCLLFSTVGLPPVLLTYELSEMCLQSDVCVCACSMCTLALHFSFITYSFLL